MNTLTQHRKPIIKYGHAQLANSAWMPRGGWYQHTDGSWRRTYAKRGRRAKTSRRAVVERECGLWKWRVEVFELAARVTRRICARGVNGYLFAQDAWGFADLAARTAD